MLTSQHDHMANALRDYKLHVQTLTKIGETHILEQITTLRYVVTLMVRIDTEGLLTSLSAREQALEVSFTFV